MYHTQQGTQYSIIISSDGFLLRGYALLVHLQQSSPSHYRGNYEYTHYFFEGQAWNHQGYSFIGSSSWRRQLWLYLALSFHHCSVSMSSSRTRQRLGNLTFGYFLCRIWSRCGAHTNWLFRGLRFRVSTREKADSRFQIWGSFCKEENFNWCGNKCRIQGSSLWKELKRPIKICYENTLL